MEYFNHSLGLTLSTPSLVILSIGLINLTNFEPVNTRTINWSHIRTLRWGDYGSSLVLTTNKLVMDHARGGPQIKWPFSGPFSATLKLEKLNLLQDAAPSECEMEMQMCPCIERHGNDRLGIKICQSQPLSPLGLMIAAYLSLSGLWKFLC